MPKDYYIVLGVSRGSDFAEIKKAYREEAKKYHPDITHSKESAEKFLEIREAYETLSNETKRKSYDEELKKRESTVRISRVPDSPGIGSRRSVFDKFDEIDWSFSSAHELFEEFLPGFFDINKGRMKAKDLYYEAILSPGEASEGGGFPVTVPVIEPCPRCGKPGPYQDLFCPICHGCGRVESERELSLCIPPHVKHGTRIRFSMEEIGFRDIYLNVTVLIR